MTVFKITRNDGTVVDGAKYMRAVYKKRTGLDASSLNDSDILGGLRQYKKAGKIRDYTVTGIVKQEACLYEV